ncbi:MAG: hypothetical protein AAF668_04350 [Pseudomonadota bacterium]
MGHAAFDSDDELTGSSEQRGFKASDGDRETWSEDHDVDQVSALDGGRSRSGSNTRHAEGITSVLDRVDGVEQTILNSISLSEQRYASLLSQIITGNEATSNLQEALSVQTKALEQIAKTMLVVLKSKGKANDRENDAESEQASLLTVDETGSEDEPAFDNPFRVRSVNED